MAETLSVLLTNLNVFSCSTASAAATTQKQMTEGIERPPENGHPFTSVALIELGRREASRESCAQCSRSQAHRRVVA